MRAIIFGGGGFLGKKLGLELLKRGEVALNGQAPQPISEMVLFDKIIAGDYPQDTRLVLQEGDICNEEEVSKLLDTKPDVIFHLAAIVSGEAEKDFDIGMNVNLRASLTMLEKIRSLAYHPVYVFASSCAVFGEDASEVIRDRTASFPKSSYGTQKAITDLLLNDFSRKGFVNGRALRLPTIAIRPGKPNAATTSFVSSIMREPLQGQKAVCPVGPETPVWILSPKRVVQNFLHAASLPAEAIGVNRCINLPGMTLTISDMVQALEAVGGKEASERIIWEEDQWLQSIVLTFPTSFEPRRALALGFQQDESFEEVIQDFLDTEIHST